MESDAILRQTVLEVSQIAEHKAGATEFFGGGKTPTHLNARSVRVKPVENWVVF